MAADSALYYFEQLFGSKTRVKLLRLFLLSEGERSFYTREIARKIGEHTNSVHRELDNLENLGLIKKTDKNQEQKIYYRLNNKFILYNELRALLLKSQLLLEKSLVRSLEEAGQVRYLVLTGSFTGVEEAKVDILIIGRVSHSKLSNLMKKFEKDLDRNLNYAIMNTREFMYRRELTDKFLYDILENKKVVLIDNLNLNQDKPKDYSRRKIRVGKR